MTASGSELEEEIAHLSDLDLGGLRTRWHSVFRRKAPDHLPRHLLYRMIAYRLQAERLGDLDRDTQRFLDQVATGARPVTEFQAGGNHPRRRKCARIGRFTVVLLKFPVPSKTFPVLPKIIPCSVA